MYFISAGGVCDSHLGKGGEGGSSWGLLHFSFISRSDVIKFHLVCGLDELHSVFFLCYNFFGKCYIACRRYSFTEF